MNGVSRISGLMAALAAGLALAGCALLAPPYDATIDQKTSTAYEAIAKIAAKVELGQLADKATYAGTADQYADIEAGLAVAAIRADNAPAAAEPARKARGLLAGLIRGCSGQVVSLASQHQKFGLAPAAGLTTAMMTSCDQAARAAQVMK